MSCQSEKNGESRNLCYRGEKNSESRNLCCRDEKRIGLLGGSFDPVHRGHLNIAASACEEYGLSEVWFIPAGHSPNKDEHEMTPAEIRAAMVALAIQDDPRFVLSRIEIDAAETSYTYRTLTKLTERYPDVTFYFIMGADSLDYFEQWRNPQIICEKAVILVAARDELHLPEIRAKIAAIQQLFPARIYPVTGGYTSISSTELRRYIAIHPEELTAQEPDRNMAARLAGQTADGNPAVCLSEQATDGKLTARFSEQQLNKSLTAVLSEQQPAQILRTDSVCTEMLPRAVAEYIRIHNLYGYRETGVKQDV